MKIRRSFHTCRAAALALVCVSALHAAVEPAKDAYEETLDQNFPLIVGASFTLGNRNGSIELETWDKNDVRVVAEKRMTFDDGGWWLARLIGIRQSRVETDAEAKALFAELAVEFSGDEKARSVRTRYPQSQEVNCSVTYRITAPRNTNIDLDTVNGSIRLVGVAGEISVSTTSGSISVEDVTGRVRAIATNGRVNLEGVSGPIVAKTTNGTVSARLSAAAQLDTVELRSVNGSVNLYLPANAAFAVKARTVNGSVNCELPLASTTERTRKRLDGVVGDGGPQVDLSTTNGSVRIGAAA